MTQAEMAARMHGRTNGDVLGYLLGRPVEGKELADLIQAKEASYRALCLLNPRRFILSPGAPELLDWLATHDILRTIATSSEVTNLNFFVRHLRLDRWFDLDRIVYDDGLWPGKPAPDIYQNAASKIGIDPHWCIVVEDAVSGLAAAQAAGIGYIVALGPPGALNDLRQLPGVSLTINSLRDFPRDRLFGGASGARA
jgi:beta-phosphoglucomutase-like phosphatase (HAD superfamily)